MKQNQIVLLIVLTIVLLLGASVFILFGNKNTKTTNSDQISTKTTPVTYQAYESEAPDYSKGRVTTSSEVEGYTIAIPREKKLVDLLFSWGIYNRRYDLRENGKNGGGVNLVTFILTNQPQKMREIKFENTKATTSTGISAYNNQLIVKVHFSANGLAKASTYISDEALYTLYLLSHPTKVNQPIAQIEAQYLKAISEAQASGPLFAVPRVK